MQQVIPPVNAVHYAPERIFAASQRQRGLEFFLQRHNDCAVGLVIQKSLQAHRGGFFQHEAAVRRQNAAQVGLFKLLMKPRQHGFATYVAPSHLFIEIRFIQCMQRIVNAGAHCCGVVSFVDFLRRLQLAEVLPGKAQWALLVNIQPCGRKRFLQQGQHGLVHGLCAGQAFRRGRGAAHHATGYGKRPLTGHKQLATALFFFPQQLFHKAAAAFFAVKKRRAADALLPEKAYLLRSGAEPVQRVGSGAFAPAGIRQAKYLP